jgi:hypothetical protein
VRENLFDKVDDAKLDPDSKRDVEWRFGSRAGLSFEAERRKIRY